MTDKGQVTQADREAVTAFHNIMAKRIMEGDPTLGENRDTIEQAFASHRIASTAKLEAERDALATACASVTSCDLTDVEIEDALVSEGIHTWGPDGERFDRMFKVVMNLRARIDTLLANQTPTPSKESE